jgi:hypothetical protein
MRIVISSALAAWIAASPSMVFSQSKPLQISNLSPLASLRAIPSQRSVETERGPSWIASATLSNHFTVEDRAGESLFLDGQTDALTLSLRYGLPEQWDVEVSVPWRHHSGGFTDNLISSWHSVFGLPDGNRSSYPTDVLLYQLSQPAHDRRLPSSVSGLGDINVAVSRPLMRIDEGQLGISAGIKTASGQSSDWLGSGTTDFYALLRFSGQQLGGGPLWWHGQAGGTRAGESDLLGPQQRRSLWFAGLATEWRFAPRWSALLQYDTHSALLDGELDALSEPAGMLSLALRWRPTSQWVIEVGFSEDVIVESAPDITFLFNASYVSRRSEAY